MNNLRTDLVNDPNIQQPFTAISLAFLQDATFEMVLGIVKTFVGDSYSAAVPYAVSGVTYTGSVSTPTSVLPGYILFGTNLIAVLSGFGPAATGARFTRQTTNTYSYNGFGADPLMFTDGVSRNVHDIIKYQIVDAASGGDFGLSQVVYIQDPAILSSGSATQKVVSPALNTSFTAINTISYYKDARGWVHLNGQLQKNQSGGGTTTFISAAAAAFRPTQLKRLSVTNVDNATNKPDYIQIATNGDMSVGNNTAGGAINTVFYLDGLSYFVGW